MWREGLRRQENLGAQVVKQASEKTNDIVGDGTTTVTLLAQSLIREGFKNVTAGADPLALKRGMEKACDLVVSGLKKIAKPVSTEEEMAQVATISAENKDLGALIARVIKEVGKDGVVTVEESKKSGIDKEIVKGLQFDQGYISPYMVTNLERMEAVLEDPYILITDKKISNIQEIVPLLEKALKTGKKDILIIADEVEGDALATLIVNRIRGIFNAIAVKSPGFGDRKKEMMQDIAVVTGGQVISEDLGFKLENAELTSLGQARKIVVTKDKTTVVDGRGKKTEIETRINQIKKQIEMEESDFDREKLQERLAKLAGGVAVIKVGAATEIEQKARQHKTEDALAATRAAIEEGIVPGGGVALLRCQKVLEDSKLKGDEKVGVNIVRRALEDPIRKIADNAGRDGSVVAADVKKLPANEGYNAAEDAFEDLLKAGVVDPVKVVRLTLQNAVSAASMLLTTECVVAEKPEEKKAGGMPGAGMGMPEY